MRRAVPLAVYAAAAVFFTWPLVLAPASRLAATTSAGDPLLNLWILGWDLRVLGERPWSALDGAIFHANIFHPARQTLAYSDHLILQAAAVWPLYAVTRDVVLCYNAVLLASLVASALAMHAFVRGVVGSTPAAYVAGLAWGFWPYRFAHLPHLQLQALYLLPLGFLFLHRLVAGVRRADALAFGAVVGLQAASSVYYGVIGAVGLAGAGAVLLWRAGRRLTMRLARRILLAAAAALVVAAPFIWPYWEVQRREGLGRNLQEAARHAATWRSYASVPHVNALYAETGLLPVAPGPEDALFPGVTVAMLAALGLLGRTRREHRPLVWALAATAAAGFVLSLGPEGVRTVYAGLHRTVFGFQAIRAPARFGVLVAFGLAGLAAVGVASLARRATRRRRAAAPVLAAGLAALIVAEYANRPLAYAEAPPRASAVAAWLRAAPEPGAVLYLPLGLGAENAPAMWESLQHGRPIVNGYSGHRPWFFSSLVETFQAFPSAQAAWTLRDLGVRFVVSQAPIDVSGWPLVERARLSGDGSGAGAFVYELRWSPAVEASLALPADPTPDPGVATFRAGEYAEYAVTWSGAGSALRAGTATVAVDAPAASNGAYRFTATVRTADWIAPFFEARDAFATVADDRLRPLRHERQIREGRRSLDRAVDYDHERQLATVVSSDGATVSFRFAPGSRDPLTALFYVRTLPLEPGAELRMPLNDAGSNLTLQLRVAVVETIQQGGRPVEALRLAPGILRRVAGRQPVDLTVWLSRDARRIPLVVEAEAGFGRVRAELASYRPGSP